MSRLRVLHLNAGKRPAVQHSLLNDDSLVDFDALTVVEPYIYQHPLTRAPTISQDRRWQVFTPTTRRSDGHARHAFRSAIWVNGRCRATQLLADSYDVTAVLLHLADRKILLASCYEARSADSEAAREAELEEVLLVLRQTLQEAKKIEGERLEVLVYADFNRHHALWGGSALYRAANRRQEGEIIVDFMQEKSLASLLPAGTVTWEHQSRNFSSTVDLVIGSKMVQDKLVYCRIHTPDHGSDHKPIETEIDIGSAKSAAGKGKRLYKEADWTKIRRRVLDRIGDGSVLSTTTDPAFLDLAAACFTAQINEVLEEEVPRARQSPYAKRWWTRELSVLRSELTRKRNYITTLRRRGQDTSEARSTAHEARRTYHDEIDRQKKLHWKEFLDDPQNVWKAAKYAKSAGPTASIPDLVSGDHTYDTDCDKADILMATFFPRPPEPERGLEAQREQRTQNQKWAVWPQLTKHEVQRAIFRSHPDKSPGTDEITFRAWRELWPVVQGHIMWLYSHSLWMSRVPLPWKTAKIVAIRKPGKADYTIPKAYRPISLLQTISKGLESVVAARLSYLAQEGQLLPQNHFGGRPRRSAEHALNTLVERIHQAWRAGRVLTLISFDVKGAFNGVHADVLVKRLKDRGAPERAVRWIESFCIDRKAKVVVGKYESGVKEIEFPGIPQGSPLSPLLYIWYNADLVDRKIDNKGGALGFVDDFNAWVIGGDEGETTRLIQETIIPHAERWAKESGATFEADKTSLIHFTKKPRPAGPEPVWFDGNRIYPKGAVKVLGVILDERLGMKEHIARVTQKGTRACLELQALKGMRPAQMRQLYRTCVTPITDYAASVWYGPGRRGLVGLTNALEKVQRLGARMILRAWKRVALPILEVEACLEPVVVRLQRKTAKHAVMTLSLPVDNPVRKAMPHTLNIAKCPSPLDRTIAIYKARLKPKGAILPLPNPAWTMPPWVEQSWRVSIKDREEAVRDTGRVAASRTMGIYTDASVGKRLVGAAVVTRLGSQTKVVRKEAIGWARTCSILAAELAAIAMALEFARTCRQNQVTVFSDSQEVLRIIQSGSTTGSKRRIVQRIMEGIVELDRIRTDVWFKWVPAHEGIVGNEEADEAAKDASSQPGKPTAPARERVREAERVIQLINRDRSENPTPFDTTQLAGQYTWKMDQALPGKHTLRLYRSLTSEQAAILIQARTGHCRLNQYLSRGRLVDSPFCGCGQAEETVKHLILSCPQWEEERKELGKVVGHRIGDVPFLLGGWGTRKDEKGRLLDGAKEKWRPDIAVVKATIRFLEQTGRLTYRQTIGAA